MRRVSSDDVVSLMRRLSDDSPSDGNSTLRFRLVINSLCAKINEALDEIDPPTRQSPISYTDGASTNVPPQVYCPSCGELADVQRGKILDHRSRIRGWGRDAEGHRVPADILVECPAVGSLVEPPT